MISPEIECERGLLRRKSGVELASGPDAENHAAWENGTVTDLGNLDGAEVSRGTMLVQFITEVR